MHSYGNLDLRSVAVRNYSNVSKFSSECLRRPLRARVTGLPLECLAPSRSSPGRRRRSVGRMAWGFVRLLSTGRSKSHRCAEEIVSVRVLYMMLAISAARARLRCPLPASERAGSRSGTRIPQQVDEVWFHGSTDKGNECHF